MTYGAPAYRPSAQAGAAAAVPAAERAAPSQPTLPTGGFSLELPRPPSVNKFMGHLGNKSPRVRDWIKKCDAEIMVMRPRPARIQGPFEIKIVWHWHSPRRGDIDNRIKPLLDYLQRIKLIENDKLCERLQVEWGSPGEYCIVRGKPWVPA